MASARPFRILMARPPYGCLGSGRLLVVGQRQTAQGLTLVFAYSHYERLPKKVG